MSERLQKELSGLREKLIAIAVMANRLEESHLANNRRETAGEFMFLSNEIQACVELVPPAAQRSEADRLRLVLKDHWLFAIHCDHAKKTDMASCACGWVGSQESNVGKAVQAWVEHVLQLLCPDCERAARHAYSDATTPGFFHTKCEKHR